jgi:hypothetical protein
MNKRAPLTFKPDRITPSSASLEQTGLSANTETPKHEKVETKTGNGRGTFIAAHVLPEAAKQFKLLAVQRDTTVQELVVEAINDLFAKHGLSRIA